jgi:site-specific DNA-methyltransferase (adenine-specific)
MGRDYYWITHPAKKCAKGKLLDIPSLSPQNRRMDNVRLMLGDCLERLRELPDNSVDSVVTDPPYGLSFMGKKWDYDVPSVDVWRECLRVLKPGGHLLAFAGTRTQHRMAVRIEDAGFEIRDMIAWVYGSGFPKSHNLKDEWQGWGTALKPALEPITVARKPLIGTVAQNVLEHGTGAINVDGCRVAKSDGDKSGWSKTGSKAGENRSMSGFNYEREPKPDAFGRWPANLIHDGSYEVDSLLNSAARFFYCAKTSKKDRNEGCDELEQKQTHNRKPDGKSTFEKSDRQPSQNNHPTVKPTDLMRYLCRLVTQPNGVVLDPFMGSGSTGKAAIIEGFQFIGIERDESYFEIARSRIETASERLL